MPYPYLVSGSIAPPFRETPADATARPLLLENAIVISNAVRQVVGIVPVCVELAVVAQGSVVVPVVLAPPRLRPSVLLEVLRRYPSSSAWVS